MRPTALVTGGAGFIGSHLCERLLATHEVWALDDVSTGSIRNIEHLRRDPAFHFVNDSILSANVVNELVYRCDVVYHLAAAVGVRLVVDEPVRTLVTNVQGTETVLDHCARFGKRVLVASTSEVYGDHPAGEPLTENAKRIYGPVTQRRWAYADSKALDEFLALAYVDEARLDAVIVRLFNTVGPKQTGTYGMAIPRFVQAALAGEPLEVYGNGMQTRCFCHVTDVVDGLVDVMRAAEPGAIYNIGNGAERISILDLARRIIDVTGSDSEITFTPYDEVYGRGIDDMLHRVPCVDKIRDELGWTPERSLETIIHDVVRHERFAAARAAPDATERFSSRMLELT